MISIIPVGEAQLPVLARIGRQSLLESHGHSAPDEVMHAYVDEKFTEEALRAELSEEANIFHIIEYRGEPAGYSKIIYDIPITPVPEKRITKMERLYLLEQFHGLDLGQQLMDYNLELAKAAGQKGMWLYVWKENRRALRFYERNGFTIVGDGFFRLTEDHANPNWQMYLPF